MTSKTPPPPFDVEELFRTQYPRIVKLCLFYMKNRADAEDAAQAVFEKIIQKKEQFRGESAPSTWLYRVAVNTVLNLLRLQKVTRWLSFSGNWENRPGDAQDPAELLEEAQEKKMQLQKLQTGIARMSEREKTAFYLFYYEHLPQKEIAAILKSSTGAVESLLHKAVKKLKEI